MIDGISINAVPNFPHIEEGADLNSTIVETLKSTNESVLLVDGSVLCVASKVVSLAESRSVGLDNIVPTEVAYDFHELLPRKDPRTIQLMIDETGDPTGSRLELSGSHIGGLMPNGLFLTSAGVDKINDERVILLPENADQSARDIGNIIFQELGVRVAVIITDSDGRRDKLGATQVAIGIYGIPPIRYSGAPGRQTQETICDMLAAAAGLVMGQRGTNKPVAVINGLHFDFDSSASIQDATSN